MKKLKWTQAEIDYLIENYFYKSYEQIGKHIHKSVSPIHRKAKELGLPSKTPKHRIEFEYGDSICKILQELHWDNEMSVKSMSSFLDVDRASIYRWMSDCDIEWRDSSEAEKLKWSKMTNEQRVSQVKAAHEKTRQMVKNGDHPLQLLWENDRDGMLQHVREIAHLGSIEREKRGNNGMLGKVGELHHNWKGGKDEYHRLRSLAKGNWWVNRKLALARDNYICQECEISNVSLDVHHITPLRNGGTNELFNLICYCRSCHQVAEWGNNVHGCPLSGV